MVPLDWEEAFAAGHIVAAFSALIVGAAVLLTPKGTRAHRAIGIAYVLVLIVVDLAALSLHRESAFGMFHWLAVASLVALGAGVSPLLLGRRSQPVVVTHAYFMTWSYAGLVAAGCGQFAVAVGHDGWVVPVVISMVLAISGTVIFGKVPTIVDRLHARQAA
jgi:uncharacterized membrane protein